MGPQTINFDERLFKYMKNLKIAEKDPVKAKELFLEELEIKKINLNIYKNDSIKAQKLVLDILESQIKQFEKANDEIKQGMYLDECERIIIPNGYCI